jgi:hypothetical protein
MEQSRIAIVRKALNALAVLPGAVEPPEAIETSDLYHPLVPPHRTPSGVRARVCATSVLPSVADDPYAKELWETACYEGNTESLQSVHTLGYKWFPGVTPP